MVTDKKAPAFYHVRKGEEQGPRSLYASLQTVFFSFCHFSTPFSNDSLERIKTITTTIPSVNCGNYVFLKKLFSFFGVM